MRFAPIGFLILVLSSCHNQPAVPAADAPHATVVMRDGSSVPGKVTESSAAELKLMGDDGVARTIPMSQVRAVDYGDAAVAAAAPVPDVEPSRKPDPAGSPVTTPAPARTPVSKAPSPVVAESSEHVHPQAAEVTSKTYELPAGTQLSVRTEETIDSSKAAEGQTFASLVTRDIHDAAGAVVIPRGSNAQIVIRSASEGGKIRGKADLVLDLASVSIDGRRYRLSTVDLVKKGKDGIGANKRTAEYSGGGAAIGAIIGAIAGGGKGAAIGAGAGAGAGAVGQVLTKGGSIKVPVESVLTFQLDRALRVQD